MTPKINITQEEKRLHLNITNMASEHYFWSFNLEKQFRQTFSIKGQTVKIIWLFGPFESSHR